jgi:hypothetical protein
MRSRSAALLAVVILLGASVSAASFKAVWKSPELREAKDNGPRKIVALIVSDDMDLRISAEEALARELNERGAEGVAAYRLIPAEELREKGKAQPWFDRAAADAVVVMRLVSSKEETVYTPVFWTTSYYGSFWDYYGYAWQSVYAPGYLDTDRIWTVETLIYRVSNGHLLWASVSEKTNPKDLRQLVHNLVKDIGKELRKEGIVPKGER